MASVYYVGEDGHVLPFVRGFSAPTAREAWNTNFYVTNSGDGTIARIDQQGVVTPFLSCFQRAERSLWREHRRHHVDLRPSEDLKPVGELLGA
jgi:hypothetical protein